MCNCGLITKPNKQQREIKMENKAKEIKEWIQKSTETPIEGYVSAEHKKFGFVTMADGRKAQVQVVLELDEEEW